MNTWRSIKHPRVAMLLMLLILPSSYLFFMPIDLKYLLLFILLGASYYKSIVDVKLRLVYLVVQLFIVAVIGAFYTPWSLCLGFYPAIVTGMLESYRRITQMVITMTAFFAVAIYFFYEQTMNTWQPYWIPAVLLLNGIPYIARVFQRSWETSMKLQDANEEIARLVKNAERQRIARDLHDTLGHTLSMITVKSELVERLIPQYPDQALKEAREVQTISRSVLLQVRELVSDMQAIDIAEEVQNAREMLESAGIEFNYEKNKTIAAAPTIRFILGMCLRECITNVVKHSGANICTVSLHEESDEFVLFIQDDGIGMEKENTRHDQFGNGLLGMKERLLLIEGKLSYESSKTDGTKVTITVPKK
ncbi:sensor histidine kinase [Alkalihalobacillus sp. AL-G]|uniref:sensor histidine kinase n=1 Tax=Alkalihalobacillus sp. AL-G TaxID=2926399 RepID=UPI00272D656E|nr:sensor histidine kinase [Alkalihalobacillus sp. AL-G]WLD92604.1 sensor histidine kinase [Alkalihalobacillus sp. AL-G]